MPTFIDWKTLSLAFLLILQTVVTGESDFVNVETPFSVDPSLDESGLVGGNLIAEGINNFNEPLQQQVPDLRVQRDPNWLVANEKDLCASSSSNQIQTPGRRRLRLKREGYLCPSDLNGNAQPPQAVRNGDQTGSTPKKETNADPLKVPSAWLDLPKNPQLCGAATGLAQFSVCHSGFPRVESYALWLENIRPTTPGLGCTPVEDLWCCLYVKLRTDTLAIANYNYPAAGSNCVKVLEDIPLRRPI